MTTRRSILLGSVLAVGLLVLGHPSGSLADGGGGGGGDATDSRTVGAPAKSVDPDYTTAVKEIKAEKFGAAIPLLEAVVAKDEKNADAYNWLAYAIRKTGDPARSIPIYQKALALDAKHRALSAKLSKLKGAEFDRQFMKAMVDGHQEVVAHCHSGATASVKSRKHGA